MYERREKHEERFQDDDDSATKITIILLGGGGGGEAGGGWLAVAVAGAVVCLCVNREGVVVAASGCWIALLVPLRSAGGWRDKWTDRTPQQQQ